MNKQSLIDELNNTQQKYPKDKNLVELIEKQVKHSPEKIAFYYQEQSISYITLNKLANKLAHFISHNIPGAGHFIAIYLDRSIETIICLLAIMKSNNTYVPIDIDTPVTQIKQIINDCKAAAIICTKQISDEVNSVLHGNNTKIINLIEQETSLQEMAETNLKISEQKYPAYLLYTSGTTGKPKGVQITHASLINLLLAMKKEVDFTQNDVLLAITPITFDISAAEIYLPLLTGGSFVFASNKARFNPYDLIKSIDQYGVTIMQATPATWQMLVNTGWKNEYRIKILCGGEGLSTWLATKLFTNQSNIWNFYGPTETTIWSTCHKIETIDKTHSLIPIGKPISNTQVYILDNELQTQPIDTPGELYIGGDGVAIGYLNNQELNNKCFIHDPFSTSPQSKLYKTGDIAQLNVDGQLHYIGRVDTQIKIRGHRIEAEAIENVLMDYDDIKECVVLDKSPSNTHELVAYITLKNAEEISLHSLKDRLKNNFPNYMIPTKFVIVDEFPLTFNGKTNRKIIPNLTNIRYVTDEIKNSNLILNKYEEIMVDLIQSFLQRTDVDPDSNFFDLGMHSMLLVDLATKLTNILNHEISAVDLFEHPTIRTFSNFIINSQHLNQQSKAPKESLSIKKLSNSSIENHNIAVIGMACKLPGADDTETFWKSIINKTESISFFNEVELVNAGLHIDLVNNPDYVAARGIIADIDKFDAAFFGYNPSEASIMDPQHRVFLEQSWTALEHSGYVSDSFSGNIGLFAGMSDSSYLLQNLLKNQQVQSDYDTQQLMLATSSHYLCTKVAYALGLKGPCVTVNTACSTGLVSIAMACESLVTNCCDMALAGAITITTPQQSGYLYRELGILSPNGHCSVFDDEAKGTVFSNGCVVVVLKKLSDALRDNDNIFGVIKGWAVNNDGATKAGFTAPSVNGQAACIKKAIIHAGIAPNEVEYIEAHGTGTLLGDPIEIAALTKGYDYEVHNESQYCALGSVKANIGHTDTAAGAAGFIKALLALREKTLPPNINYKKANKKINFSQTPYYVNEKTQTWETKHKRRNAAVHSLGLGGTNAHIIIQESPEIKTTASKQGNIIILSAKTSESLTASIYKLHQHILKIPQNDQTEKTIADIAYTLQVGRKAFKCRTAIAYTEYEHLLKELCAPTQVLIQNIKNNQIIFGFVGQGAQYASMAVDLYKEHPYFRDTVDDCCEYLKQYMDIDLREILFPTNININDANKALRETEYAQPALFIIEYAISQLLIKLGIKPTGMIGHSVGEYVAATISGVLDIKDALKLIVIRASLMAKTEPGVMLAVPLSKEKISEYLTTSVNLAVHNAPNLCIVAGTKEDIANFELSLQPLLDTDHLSCQYLHTSHAFHSKHMDGILKDFLNYTSNIVLKEPTIPYISNVTGRWITQTELNNKQYWADHIRNTVLFSEGIDNLCLSDNDIFIEIGPGQTLLQLIRQHRNKPGSLLHTLPHYQNYQDNSYGCFLNTIGKLWLLNIDITWTNLYTNEIRQRIALPTYSFERKSHWIYPNDVTNMQEIKTFTKNMLYTTTWERDRKLSLIPKNDYTKNKCWIVFRNKHHSVLINQLQKDQELVYIVDSGSCFKQSKKFNFTINPKNQKHYFKLLQIINIPYDNCTVIHTWLTTNRKLELDSQQILQKGPFCLLYLSQAYTDIYPNKNLNVLVLANSIYSVLGNEVLIPTKAAILGPCKVIPQEQENITFKLIDFDNNNSLINHIYWEANTISQSCFKTEISYRAGYRWKMKLQPCLDCIEETKSNRLKVNGVYLITGGLGGIGLILAQYLAKKYHANIILVTRSNPLPENEWTNYLSNHKDKDQKIIQQINILNDIKNHAASLTINVASVEDETKMGQVIQSIQQKFGHIDGVIHAAGIAGGGAAHLKNTNEYQKVLTPKVFGTSNLINLLKDEPLDFIVFISSITSITGFPGQVDYCSANRVLDAYALSINNFTHPVFCVTMNWQAWRDIGMAAESKTLLIKLDESNSIIPEDGCLLFEKIVNSNLNQVIISNEDLNLYSIHKSTSNSLINIPESSLDTQPSQYSDVIEILQDIWSKTLGISEIKLDDDFYELGGHSLLAISLLAKVRKAFNLKIPSTTLFNVRTIRALSTVINSYNENSDEYSPLIMLQKGDSFKPPLFMVHPVGGTLFCYLPLINELNKDRTIYGFQDPSIEQEIPLFSTIEELALCYRKKIQQIQPTGPYYLCGASFGASVVTEIAFQLQEIGEHVNFVGLIDGWGILSKTQFDVDYVKEIIHLHKNTSSNIDNQEIWEKMLQHRLNMMLNYTHKKISVKISLFKATEILSEYLEIDKEDNHWTNYSSLPIDIFKIPGDHNTMLQNPNVYVLAKYIKLHLEN